MIQNVLVAGASRRLGTAGIHLKEIGSIGQRQVLHALMDVESKYEILGGTCFLSSSMGNLKIKPKRIGGGAIEKTKAMIRTGIQTSTRN